MVGSKDDVHDNGPGLVSGDVVSGSPVLEAGEGVLEGHAIGKAVVNSDTSGRVVDVRTSVEQVVRS